MTRREPSSVGARNGAWGEDVAAECLRRDGYVIIDRNARPVSRDHRLEIDIVAYDRESDTMVFVEVKQHKCVSPYQRRLRSINRKKKHNLLRAFRAWRRVTKWLGDFRFDVIEVYGQPDAGKPVIDHIRNVELFVPHDRFVSWSKPES